MHPAFVAKLRLLEPERARVVLEDEAAQKSFLDRVASRAKSEGFTSDRIYMSGGSAVLTLDSGVKHRNGYSSDHVTMRFAKGRPEIALEWRSANGIPLVDEEHALLVLQRVRERLVLEMARAAKRAKLSDLRVRAFEGRLQALAAARDVEYAIEGMHGKVQLALKVDARRSFVVDLPWRAALDDVDKIGPLFDELRALFDRGLRFDVRAAQRHAKWKKPPPL